jgi:predicted DCC family thiol-disulfide oxidoreductase YuxK
MVGGTRLGRGFKIIEMDAAGETSFWHPPAGTFGRLRARRARAILARMAVRSWSGPSPWPEAMTRASLVTARSSPSDDGGGSGAPELGHDGAPLVLFVDRDCGFCVWSAALLTRAARPASVRVLALDSAPADAALGHLAPAERWASWHARDATGRLYSGGAVFTPLLRMTPGGSPLAAVVSAAPRLADALYRAVARRRSRWGRLVPLAWVDAARRRLAPDLSPHSTTKGPR